MQVLLNCIWLLFANNHVSHVLDCQCHDLAVLYFVLLANVNPTKTPLLKIVYNNVYAVHSTTYVYDIIIMCV